jgi:phosphatidylserine decarboxylase
MSCNLYKNFIPKFTPHGINIILIFLAVTFILGFFSTKLMVIGGFFSLFSLYFFRDPERKCIQHDNLVISPSDGLITFIGKVTIPEKFGIQGEFLKISIFLSVFDIHVNRLPVSGTIKNIIYSPGKFISATNDKESDDNECNTLIIENKLQDTIVTSQIAGLIARRIVCDIKKDEEAKIGERFGIIKFGSRMNVYVPLDYKISVIEGQRVIGGETILGFAENEKEIFNNFN